MKTSIETINGQLCTVIRKPFCADYVREQLEMGVPVVCEYGLFDDSVVRHALFSELVLDAHIALYGEAAMRHTLTILPALPRNPTADDAPLLYRYASKGVLAQGYCDESQECYDEEADHVFKGEVGFLEMLDFMVRNQDSYWRFEITHATDTVGNIVDIAIVDVTEQLDNAEHFQQEGNKVAVAITDDNGQLSNQDDSQQEIAIQD